MKCRLLAGAVLATLLSTSSVWADEFSKHEASAQGTGFFTKDTTGNGRTQRSTETGGFLLGYRYHFNRWLAAEVNYGRVRNTERTFSTIPGVTIPPIFGPGPRVINTTSAVQADIHEATAAAVVTLPFNPLRLHPYVLAGAGALTFVPTQNLGAFVPGAGNQAKATFVYGGGVDYSFTRHIALRLEYRGLVYGRPDFGLIALRSNTTTHTAQPSAGFVVRF
jgi:opacity protein-like surface antigen